MNRVLALILMSSCFLLNSFANPNDVPVSGRVAPVDVLQEEPAHQNQVAVSEPPAFPVVTGKISFYFQNIGVKTLLQLIAKNSNLNFIISENVKGNTTLNLKDVTWRQALDIILKSHGLASRQIGSAIYISTADDITQQEVKQLQSVHSLEEVSPLKTSVVRLRYSNAEDIAKVLKGSQGSLLTARGDVSLDKPTNTIIIRDIKSNLHEVVHYVRKLDIPAPQVSIEARIVNMSSNFEAQLGVRFGVSNTKSLSGTLTGGNELAKGTNVANVPIAQRLNFNMPSTTFTSGAVPASVGLALARLGPILLDLELSALEEEGYTQIVAKPRVVTANQKKAIIQAGQEIPYQQATSSGATSIEFKKAVLSLEITPQITPDNKIILFLKANQDAIGKQLIVSQGAEGAAAPTVFGPPTINTQSVESNIMLNDNETVVIGGIYQLNKANQVDRVPFFSDIPLVGGLFKYRRINNSKSELLIFITPRIIKPKHHYAYQGD